MRVRVGSFHVGVREGNFQVGIGMERGKLCFKAADMRSRVKHRLDCVGTGQIVGF